MKETEYSKSNAFIKDLLSGREEDGLKKIYNDYMDHFMVWAGKRFSKANREDLMDAFQDSVIAFYEQVKSGKLQTLTCDIKTFLFGIGERRLINNFRKMGKIEFSEDQEKYSITLHEVIQFDWDEPWVEEKSILLAALNQISSQCKEALKLRYIDGLKIQEIMKHFSYDTANVTSATLSRCMKGLKDLIKNNII